MTESVDRLLFLTILLLGIPPCTSALSAQDLSGDTASAVIYDGSTGATKGIVPEPASVPDSAGTTSPVNDSPAVTTDASDVNEQEPSGSTADTAAAVDSTTAAAPRNTTTAAGIADTSDSTTPPVSSPPPDTLQSIADSTKLPNVQPPSTPAAIAAPETTPDTTALPDTTGKTATEIAQSNLSRTTKIIAAAGTSAVVIGVTTYFLVKFFHENREKEDTGIPDPPDPPGYW